MSPPDKGPGFSPAVDHARWFADEVQPHEPALRGYLRNTFPSVDVDEVVQQSYLKLWRARLHGRITSTKAYVFSIARNTAITLFHRRRIYSETPVSELPGWRVLDGGADAADAADVDLRIELVTTAFDQLPSRCRDVLRLAVLRGMSNAEIAAHLGMAENTVRVHLARGIKKCAGFLRERGERQ